MLSKQQIIEALRKWINQRPGLEFGNYGDWLRRHFRREFGRGIASRWFN